MCLLSSYGLTQTTGFLYSPGFGESLSNSNGVFHCSSDTVSHPDEIGVLMAKNGPVKITKCSCKRQHSCLHSSVICGAGLSAASETACPQHVRRRGVRESATSALENFKQV